MTLTLHIAAGRQQARAIIAHPEQHGPQRRLVAWLALGATWDRLRHTAEPRPNLGAPSPQAGWWRLATVIDNRAAAWASNDGGNAA